MANGIKRQELDTSLQQKMDLVVDAGVGTKGVVSLNSATNSASETEAATPKAVKAAYDQAVLARTYAP